MSQALGLALCESVVFMAFYTYILRCADDSLYTGWTTDLEHRLRAHNGEVAGGAKYTRARRPVRLVWSHTSDTKEGAQALERRIKTFTRKEKEKLVTNLSVL